MSKYCSLEKKQKRIKRQINDNLDLLIGSISSKGSKGGHNLTFKVDQKTKSKHIRKDTYKKVVIMTKRHQIIKQLLSELSDVNWELLKLDSEKA